MTSSNPLTMTFARRSDACAAQLAICLTGLTVKVLRTPEGYVLAPRFESQRPRFERESLR